MPETTFHQDDCTIQYTTVLAVTAGDIVQVPDGRAGQIVADAAAGTLATAQVKGTVIATKTTSMCLLNGGRAYWDASAGKAHYKKVNDRDFYVGRVQADAAFAATTCYVALNVDPAYDIDLHRDAFLSVPTGTQAVGGFGYPKVLGGAHRLELTATSEAQAIDLLSRDKFAVASNPIAEIIFTPNVNGTGAAVDFNVGLANGTSTSDADAVTEYVYVHLDGSDTKLYVQSKDGSTTVAAADSLSTISAGSAVANRVEVWIDARDPSDVQVYVNAVNVLPSSVFKLDAAVGPLGLLSHLEKSTGTTTGQFDIEAMRVRLMEQ